MKITVGGKEVLLNDTDVKISRNLINSFLSSVKAKAAKAKRPTLYFTFIIMMYKKSMDLLYEVSPESLQILMDLLNQEAKPEDIEPYK